MRIRVLRVIRCVARGLSNTGRGICMGLNYLAGAIVYEMDNLETWAEHKIEDEVTRKQKLLR